MRKYISIFKIFSWFVKWINVVFKNLLSKCWTFCFNNEIFQKLKAITFYDDFWTDNDVADLVTFRACRPRSLYLSRTKQLYLFQSYAEITSVSPALGSVHGGTSITITGRNFDQTRSPAKVKISGQCSDSSRAKALLVLTILSWVGYVNPYRELIQLLGYCINHIHWPIVWFTYSWGLLLSSEHVYYHSSQYFNNIFWLCFVCKRTDS